MAFGIKMMAFASNRLLIIFFYCAMLVTGEPSGRRTVVEFSMPNRETIANRLAIRQKPVLARPSLI